MVRAFKLPVENLMKSTETLEIIEHQYDPCVVCYYGILMGSKGF